VKDRLKKKELPSVDHEGTVMLPKAIP